MTDNLEQRRADSIAHAVKTRQQRILTFLEPAPIKPGWVEQAACIQIGPFIFEDPDPEHRTHARNICGTCPVRQSCLEAALTEEAGHPASYRSGIRGSLNPGERVRLTNLRKQAAEDAA